jgi:hypothetical protein
VKILTTNEVVYTSLAYREPGPVNRASSIIYSTGLVSIPTGVVHRLPRDKLVSGSEQPLRRKIRFRERESGPHNPRSLGACIGVPSSFCWILGSAPLFYLVRCE